MKSDVRLKLEYLADLECCTFSFISHFEIMEIKNQVYFHTTKRVMSKTILGINDLQLGCQDINLINTS